LLRAILDQEIDQNDSTCSEYMEDLEGDTNITDAMLHYKDLV